MYQKYAVMVNAMSALASAFTILFLFWTITHLARKILLKEENDYSTARIIAVMSAGIVGALAYTFSDSFWFSAVEGEVYASSSLFTALVFWAILKWEDVAEEKYADRWIILIAFLMGLSIGVHLLNLLAIPAIVLVYYFKKFEFSWRGLLFSLATSVIILFLLMYGIMPGVVTISSKFDWVFINTLGLPSNSGMVFHVIMSVYSSDSCGIFLLRFVECQEKCCFCYCSTSSHRNLGNFRISFSEYSGSGYYLRVNLVYRR